MQGCFKSSLAGLREADSALPGRFYAAFFNYAIGLERLLKIILLLDKWHHERKFLTDDELRAKGHNVQKLYNDARPLFARYTVKWNPTYEPDKIRSDLLSFLANFANGNRYYNLTALAGALPCHAVDPIQTWEELLYRVYEQDVPNAEPITLRENAEDPDFDWTHDVVVAAASPYMCCRLVQLLAPLQRLLIAINRSVKEDDFKLGGEATDPSIPPNMEEFLDFVCEDKAVILQSQDWP